MLWLSSLVMVIGRLSVECWAQQLKEEIYSDIGNIRPCFRRMNSTHQIGCSSDIGGNVGVVIYLETEGDLDKLKNNEFAPYVVLIDPYILSSELLHKLEISGLVAGVMLPNINTGKWADHYPRQGYSDDARSAWNPRGQGTMWRNWNFPIFYLENTTVAEQVHSCYSDHNDQAELSWPLCSLELKSNMYGSGDSETCLRRSSLFSISPVRVCDPLSDDNIHYFLSPRQREEPEDPNSVIVVAAKMDALSLFDQVEVGFDSPATGIVALLSVANAVSKAVKNNPLFRNGINNVLFLLIHGESFDHIGSTRLVDDMMKSGFPFNNSEPSVTEKSKNGSQPNFSLENIHSFIELDQLGNINNNKAVYVHSNNNPADIVSLLKQNKGELKVSEVPNNLPPSSSQSFLAERPGLPSVIISNYNLEFSNPAYHSVYDTAERAGYDYSAGPGQPLVRHLARLTEMVTRTVLSLATSGPAPAPASLADPTLILELLYCYGVTANCSKFYEASEPDNYPWLLPPEKRGRSPFPQYVGVRSSFHTLMTKLMLQYLTGTPVETVLQGDPDHPDHNTVKDEMNAEEVKRCRDKNSDQNIYSFVYLVADPDCYNASHAKCGQCYRTTVHLSPALSPAMAQVEDWHLQPTPPSFPTWTESIWKTISARMFLKGSPGHDQGIFVFGLLVLGISVISTFWVNKKSAIIFQNPGAAKLETADNPVPVEM